MDEKIFSEEVRNAKNMIQHWGLPHCLREKDETLEILFDNTFGEESFEIMGYWIENYVPLQAELGKQTIFKDYFPELLQTAFNQYYFYDEYDYCEELGENLWKFKHSTFKRTVRSLLADSFLNRENPALPAEIFVEGTILLSDWEIPDDADYGLWLLTKFYAPWIMQHSKATSHFQNLMYLAFILLPTTGMFQSSKILKWSQNELLRLQEITLGNYHASKMEPPDFSQNEKIIKMVIEKKFSALHKDLIQEIKRVKNTEFIEDLEVAIPCLAELEEDVKMSLLTSRYGLREAHKGNDFDFSLIPLGYTKAIELMISKVWEKILVNVDFKNESPESFFRNLKYNKKDPWTWVQKSCSFQNHTLISEIENMVIGGNNRGPKASGLQKSYMLCSKFFIHADICKPMDQSLRKFSTLISDIEILFLQFRNGFAHTHILEKPQLFKMEQEIFARTAKVIVGLQEIIFELTSSQKHTKEG